MDGVALAGLCGEGASEGCELLHVAAGVGFGGNLVAYISGGDEVLCPGGGEGVGAAANGEGLYGVCRLEIIADGVGCFAVLQREGDGDLGRSAGCQGEGLGGGALVDGFGVGVCAAFVRGREGVGSGGDDGLAVGEVHGGAVGEGEGVAGEIGERSGGAGVHLYINGVGGETEAEDSRTGREFLCSHRISTAANAQRGEHREQEGGEGRFQIRHVQCLLFLYSFSGIKMGKMFIVVPFPS